MNRVRINSPHYLCITHNSMFLDDPPPYKDGVRINSPHYLCKMVEEKGTSLYNLVISQYEKTSTIHYTLRVYATCKFSLTKISEPYTHEKQVRQGFVVM